jgi:hypothetical protein
MRRQGDGALCGLGEEAVGRDAIPALCPNAADQYSGGQALHIYKMLVDPGFRIPSS